MSILSAMAGIPDINEGLEEFRKTEGAVLLDVREPDEFAQGHVPGAVNIPLRQFMTVQEQFPDKSTPLFVYCLVGGRSKRACTGFTKLGYTDVHNIGAFNAYKGPAEKSTAW